MSAGGVLFVRSSVANDAFQNDQHRLAAIARFKLVHRCVDRIEIVGVGYRSGPPSQTFETFGDVFAKRQFGVAFDRDIVVVVDPAKVAEGKVTGERSGFCGDAFHQVAVAAK